MAVRVGINGFGRIGRNFFRAAKASGADIDFVAVNDLGDIKMMAHLLKNDSVFGRYPGKVSAGKKDIVVEGDRLAVLSERNPADLPWDELGVDVVIESTGIFTNTQTAGAHIKAGARKVIISAPADCHATFVMGVNEHTYNPARHHVISNASCTTNCLAPMAKVLDDAFGIEQGLINTIHAYTGDQALVDGPHKDPRRARAAAVNVVPTSTGAARATGLVLKKMNGRLDGMATRVPVVDGSFTDLTAVLKKSATEEQINAAFKAAARSGPLRKVLDYSEEPLVSTDIIGRTASCTFDSGITMSMGKLVKIGGWYDNEMGYSSRLVDLAELVGKKKAPRKKAPAKKKAVAKKAPAKKKAAKKK